MSGTERLRLDLASSLESCGVSRAKTLGELLAVEGKAAFLEQPALRLADHFELDPDVLLIDPRVATLGLVHVLPDGGLGKAVQESIDRATYVRHLLLTAPDRKDHLPYAVELILVAADSDKNRQAVAKALRTVARRTSYLHAIGVSELYHPGKAFDEDSLRRAFPWLLRATRTWLNVLDDAGTRTSWKLLSLTLESYRLPGRRTLKLDPSARLHLAHGHNGSGKSSLAEALELAMTGTVERLDLAGEATYEGVLTNRDARAAATVTLEVLEQPAAGAVEKKRGVARDPAQALSPGLKATSFRLDQTLMDRLARMGDEKRAITFLESFFPKEHKTYEEYRQAEQRRREALAALGGILTLPPVAEGKALDAFLARYAAVDVLLGTLDPEIFDQILPLPLAALRELARAAPGLRPQIEAWQTSRPPMQRLAEELARLDEELAKAAPDVLGALARLRPAVEILRGMRGWVARARTATGQDPAVTLNAWLELCALVDLAEKQIQLARSLAGAQQKGWSPAQVASADMVLKASLAPADLASLESCLKIWTHDRDRLAEDVRNLRRRAGPLEEAAESAAAAPPPHLSDEQIAALDAVGPWLLPSGEAAETAPFGKLINDAVTSGETLSYGDLPIGTPGWVDGLLPRLEPLLQACVQAEPVVGAPRAAERLRILREAVQSHRKLQEEGGRVRTTFLERIRPEAGSAADRRLDHALNELMALFTPARHEEIGLAYQSRETGGSGQLLFTLQKSKKKGSDRAELLFNTAELNVFTLTLFLLCSVRIDNRLSLLILDDPLQNMDEQTVTTVARGLARLVRILPEPWQILLLFHGEDDLERFRQEVPCAIYLLPWLAPAATESKIPEVIEPQPGNVSTTPQSLMKLLAERPARRAVS